MFGCHSSMAEVPPSQDGLHLLTHQCPACDGEGYWTSGERCCNCHGRGAVEADELDDWYPDDTEDLPKETPAPPAVMKSPCADCAFRPGSPEQDEPPSLDRPFFCHKGMPVVSGAYAPVAWYKGVPLGAFVCAGWWAAATGQPLPESAYRPARDGWGEPHGPAPTTGQAR